MKYAGLDQLQKRHDIQAWFLREAEIATTCESLLRGGKVRPSAITQHVIDETEKRAKRHPEEKELLNEELPKFLQIMLGALENIRQKRQVKP